MSRFDSTTLRGAAVALAIAALPITSLADEMGGEAPERTHAEPKSGPRAILDDTGRMPKPSLGRRHTTPLHRETMNAERPGGPAAALDSIEPERRANVRLHAVDDDTGVAQTVANLWNGGHHQAAIDAAKNSDAGFSVIAEPLDAGGQALPSGGADVPIWFGDMQGELEIQRHTATGNLFVLKESSNGYTVFSSDNEGVSWQIVYDLHATGGLVDLDLCCAGDYVYVASTPQHTGYRVHMHRAIAATESVDNTYGETIADFYDGVSELSIASNSQVFDNVVYIFTMTGAGGLDYRWDLAHDGNSFDWVSTAGFPQIAGGLDVAWTNDINFLWVSYIGTDGQVHVARRHNGFDTWDNQTIASADTDGVERTAISGHEDTVACAFRTTDGAGLTYRITYNAGDTWGFADLYDGGQGPVGSFDIEARGGYGIAAAYQIEAGFFDPIEFRHRAQYGAGPWTEAVVVNDNDTYTIDTIAMTNMQQSTSPAAQYDFGLVYPTVDDVWFDRMTNCPADLNGDGVVDVNDMLTLMAQWGECDGCVSDLSLDGFVDVDDMLSLISAWGECD